MREFIPDAIYYEENITQYELGKYLLEKYKSVPKFIIENHNNIEEMRKKENKEFPKMKRNLIIGIRKTHKFVPNNKISNYLVPYTSSRMYSNVPVLLFGLQLQQMRLFEIVCEQRRNAKQNYKNS